MVQVARPRLMERSKTKAQVWRKSLLSERASAGRMAYELLPRLQREDRLTVISQGHHLYPSYPLTPG